MFSMKKFLKYNRIYSKNSVRFFGFYFGGYNSHNIKFTLLKYTVVFKNSHKVVQPSPLFNSSEEDCEATSSHANIPSPATTRLLWIHVSWTF